jgi:hypothetical protein
MISGFIYFMKTILLQQGYLCAGEVTRVLNMYQINSAGNRSIIIISPIPGKIARDRIVCKDSVGFNQAA